ncbi:MAG: tRNA lysidine(34) synthetase TilS [Candidatus Brocadiia bacterium]
MLATIRRGGLLAHGDRVVVAVSGGPDSMALLEALVALRERLGLELWVGHLDHGLRGAAGAADAAFVAARARELGLPVEVGRAEVGRGGSVEHAARRARYAFLERLAGRLGAGRVALGHTADDQVETILEGLLRGGELGALCGMPASRPIAEGSAVRVVRPLLEVRREEGLAFLARRGVGYRVDESNADLDFERNLVRHRLLPLLEGRAGPGLRSRLLDLAGRASDFAAAALALADALVGEDAEGVRLEARRLAAQPRLVRRLAVRRAYVRAGGSGELRRRAIDAVEHLLGAQSGRRAELAGGLVAWREYDAVRVGRPAASPRPVHAVLPVPGRLELPQAGLWVEAELLEGPAPGYSPDRWEELVDLGRTGRPLAVRTRRPGERFQPLGLGGSKAVKDLLTDQRVPRRERARQLVVVGRCGIAWVVGRRLDERARVTPATRRVARLRAGPLAAGEGPPQRSSMEESP